MLVDGDHDDADNVNNSFGASICTGGGTVAGVVAVAAGTAVPIPELVLTLVPTVTTMTPTNPVSPLVLAEMPALTFVLAPALILWLRLELTKVSTLALLIMVLSPTLDRVMLLPLAVK